MRTLKIAFSLLLIIVAVTELQAQSTTDSVTKKVVKKYQAKAPKTKPFGKEAFAKSNKTTLRWLSMAGFLINSRGTTLMVDPLLEGYDMPIMVDFPIAAKDVPSVDAILATHSDNDHYSVPTCKALAGVTKSYHSTVYVDSLMKNEKLPSFGHNIGDVFKVGKISVKLTPADHAWQNAYPGASKRFFMPEDACGFWIETPDGTIWAPGDSRLMPAQLKMHNPDVILLDYSEDAEWHFGLEGSVKLINAYPNAQVLLGHWGTVDAPDFAPFNGDPMNLIKLAKNLKRIHVLAPGEPFTLKLFTKEETETTYKKDKIAMTNNSSTRHIIDKFFDFASKRDLENLSNLFSDKVDWNVPGNEKIAPWLGQRNSRAEVRRFYELLWQNVTPVSSKINKIFIDNGDAVIAGEFSVKMLQTGKIVNSIFYIQITVENNLIKKYRLLEDSYAISKSLTIPSEIKK